MTRISRAYKTYLRRYAKRENFLRTKGKEMHDVRLGYKNFKMSYESYADEKVVDPTTGKKIRKYKDIVGEIVANQATYVRLSVGRRLKRVAKEHGFEWSNMKVLDIVTSVNVDDRLSEINETLKVAFPTWTGKERARWVSHYVFGSP